MQKMQLPKKFPYSPQSCIKKGLQHFQRRYENALKMQLPTLCLTFSFSEVASRCKKMQKKQLLAKTEMQKNVICISSPPPEHSNLSEHHCEFKIWLNQGFY
jgi:hypothetical protein